MVLEVKQYISRPCLLVPNQLECSAMIEGQILPWQPKQKKYKQKLRKKMKADGKKTDVIDKQIDTNNISKQSSNNYSHSSHSLYIITIDVDNSNDTQQLSVNCANANLP